MTSPLHGRGGGLFGFDQGVTVLVLDPAKIDSLFAPSQMVFRYMDAVTREMTELAKVNVISKDRGYQTGELVDSIGNSVTPAGKRQIQGNIRASSSHAIFYHNPTRAHTIYAHTPIVRIAGRTPTGGMTFRWRARGDKFVRANEVRHPAWAGNPFLTDAMSEVLRIRGIKKL